MRCEDILGHFGKWEYPHLLRRVAGVWIKIKGEVLVYVMG
jgi:hypothetical protein